MGPLSLNWSPGDDCGMLIFRLGALVKRIWFWWWRELAIKEEGCSGMNVLSTLGRSESSL